MAQIRPADPPSDSSGGRGVARRHPRGAFLFIGALLLLYFAIWVAALPAAILGFLAQRIPQTIHPQWGSTLPSPWAEAVAFFIGLPILLIARRPLLAPHLSRAKRLFLVSLFCVLAISAGAGFFAGLRSQVIPAEGLAARELLEEIDLRGFRLVREDDEGNANVSPFKEFVAEGRPIDANLIRKLPSRFEPDQESSSHSIWLYSETIAAWSGPHPYSTQRECWITLDELEPYREDPVNLVRATVHAVCEPL